MHIGCAPINNTNFFEGLIDDVRVYNRPLSTSEIDSLYREGGWPLPLVANFTADQTNVPIGTEIQFTDQSTGTPTSWEWDFDNDGTIDSTDENPVYTYTSAGTYTVSLTVSDGTNNDTETKTDYITVTTDNIPPTINLPDDFTFEEDGNLVVDFTPYVFDADGDALTLESNGTGTVYVEINDLQVTFTAEQDWNGADLITFAVYDEGGTSTEYVAYDDVEVIVTPVSDAPTITLPDDFTFEEDGTLAVDFTPYVYDGDGDALTLESNGTGTVYVEINDMEVTFTAEQDWNGADLITFAVYDEGGTTTEYIAYDDVEVIVLSVNDMPTISLPTDFTFAEDETLQIDFLPFIEDNDLDDLSLTYSGNSNITVSIDGTLVTFGAVQNWHGSENITFTVDDGVADATSSDDMYIIVTSVNDAPEGNDDQYDMCEDAVLNIIAPGVLTNDHDIDSPSIIAQLETTSSNGNLLLNSDGSFVY
ncbi:MAG: hypothetical protein DRG69_09220, partial [Deltaproteobacteria bacterium]